MSCDSIKSGLSTVFVPTLENKKTLGAQVTVTLASIAAAVFGYLKLASSPSIKYACIAVMAAASSYALFIAYKLYKEHKATAAPQGAQNP